MAVAQNVHGAWSGLSVSDATTLTAPPAEPGASDDMSPPSHDELASRLALVRERLASGWYDRQDHFDDAVDRCLSRLLEDLEALPMPVEDDSDASGVLHQAHERSA
jgi:hypothetical protein